MFCDTEEYVNLLVRNQLTPEEFLLCYLLHAGRIDLIERYAANVYFYDAKYQKNFGFSATGLQKLVDKGFIYDNNASILDGNPRQWFPTSTFRELAFTDLHEGFDEIWQRYPHTITVNNKSFPAKTGSYDALEKEYYRAIRRQEKKHKEVIELLDWGLENQQVCMGIAKFIGCRHWETLATIREEGFTLDWTNAI